MSYVTLAQIFIPQDIISVIFCILKESDRYYGLSCSKFNPSLRWIPQVTHVCHSWREIALSNSSLWTDIKVGASVSWAVEFARRSGQAPIRIWLDLPAPKFSNCTKTLLHENMQRILEIKLNNVDAEDILSAAVSEDNELQPFPILESLTIDFSSQARSDFLLTNRNISAPNLKRLTLEGGLIGEDFRSFRNLSHLSVSDCSFPMTTAIFLHNALSEMSNLESLEITIIIPSILAVDFGNQVIALPKLRKLYINGWPIELAISILQAITHGPLRSVCVRGCPTHRLDQVLHLFNSITPHAIGNQNIDQLYLSIETVRGALMIRCDMGQNFLWEADLSDTRPPSQADNPSRYLLEGLLRMVNYQHLNRLELHFPKPLSALLWVEYFGQLWLLTSIRISQGVRELFKALMDGLSEDAPNVSTTTPSFPALKELTIENRSESYSKEYVAFMLQCLRKRLDHGIGLEILYFRIKLPDNFDLDDDSIYDELKEDLRAQLAVFTDVVECMAIFWV